MRTGLPSVDSLMGGATDLTCPHGTVDVHLNCQSEFKMYCLFTLNSAYRLKPSHNKNGCWLPPPVSFYVLYQKKKIALLVIKGLFHTIIDPKHLNKVLNVIFMGKLMHGGELTWLWSCEIHGRTKNRISVPSPELCFLAATAIADSVWQK